MVADVLTALANIDLDVPLDERPLYAIAFMLEALELIRAKLLPVAARALDVARAYWGGAGSAEALALARKECWYELEAKSSSLDTERPLSAAIRGVICVLQPKEDNSDWYDLVSFFVSLSNKVDDRSVQQLEILRRLFPPA